MSQYNSAYEVPPLSRLQIRRIAKNVRSIFNITTPMLPVVDLLEVLHQFGINTDIIDDLTWVKQFGINKYAEYNLMSQVISIKESVYDRAVLGIGRDRFTIAHEIAHALLLDGSSIKVSRSSNGSSQKCFCDPEWQADCLAGELLVPYDHCKNMSVEDIMHNCGVSRQAALTQMSKF